MMTVPHLFALAQLQALEAGQLQSVEVLHGSLHVLNARGPLLIGRVGSHAHQVALLERRRHVTRSILGLGQSHRKTENGEEEQSLHSGWRDELAACWFSYVHVAKCVLCPAFVLLFAT